jgi:hypothetical protein
MPFGVRLEQTMDVLEKTAKFLGASKTEVVRIFIFTAPIIQNASI